MNRHHPYGGPYDSPARRGGSPSGPGPDRSHQRFSQDNRGGPPRGRGGGLGRGRGYGGYDAAPGHGAYDQGPPQGDVTPYNSYDNGPQDPFYQNTGYSGPPPPVQYGGPPGPSDGYNQGFGNFEDGPGSNFDEGGYGNRPQRRNIRREKDDKLHDSIIEERIQRERPCRTLFIRNIKYETNSDDVRRQFEEHGEIKTFFDLISTRGMVFVTYYDLRAAERARERLQGSEISGRPIDVHYSLPRDDSKGGDKSQQQLQGTLLVTLRNSASGQAIDDNEVRRKFQQFGDVKSVNPVGDHADQRYVEFYDTRACGDSYDRLRHQGLQDGVMDIVFAWDAASDGAPPGNNQRRDDKGYDNGRDWDDRGSRGRGGRGRGRGRGRGYDDGGYDRREEWDRDRGRGRYEDDYGGRGGRGGRGGYGGGYGGDRYDSRGGGGGGGGYGAPPGPPGPPQPHIGYGNGSNNTMGSYGLPPPPPPPPPPPLPAVPVDERVEQARKVQQLLAALKQPQNGASSAPPSSGPPPSGGYSGLPSLPQPQANSNGFYPPPPPNIQRPPFPGSLPPPANTNPYGSMPPPSSTPQPGQGQGQPAIGTIPPNILALLQQSQSQPQAAPGLYNNMPPQQTMNSPPSSNMPPHPQPNYNQLMAYLSQAATSGPK